MLLVINKLNKRVSYKTLNYVGEELELLCVA